MSQFDLAMPRAFALEGGYVDDPKDPGGATNYGISLRWLATLHTIVGGHDEGDVNGDGKIDINDIKQMTPTAAAAIYKAEWWDRYKYGLLDPQALADKVFCTAINMGAPPAQRILQTSLNGFGDQHLTVDGNMGPKTIAAVRWVISKYSINPLLAAYRIAQAGYYRELVAHNPALAKFLNGWLKRAAL